MAATAEQRGVHAAACAAVAAHEGAPRTGRREKLGLADLIHAMTPERRRPPRSAAWGRCRGHRPPLRRGTGPRHAQPSAKRGTFQGSAGPARGDQADRGGGEAEPGDPQRGQPLAQQHPGQQDRHGRIQGCDHRGDGQQPVVGGKEEHRGSRGPDHPGQHAEPPGPGRWQAEIAGSGATHATVTVAVTWEMTMGHRSVPDPARSRPMTNSPNPAPAARPSPTPPAWRGGRGPVPAGRVQADTPTIAGGGRQMPIGESEPGRSPSASPASTENVAVPPALIELATLNAAYRNPRYSANAPATPLAPAPAPQSADASDGAWLLTNGITQISRTVLVTSTSTVTRTTLALRAASPAAKSDPPYPAAAASASKTATIDQVRPGLRAGLARRSRFWEHRLGQCRLVSKRDRQLARRRGVERRRRAQALYI